MKVAVIGMGSMGTRHANNIKALGHKAIPYDPAKGWNDWPTGYEAVVVATPPDQRMSFSVPTLYEKPIASRVSDAFKLTVCDEGSVAYNWRFDPDMTDLYHEVQSGVSGKPIYAVVDYGFALDLWRPGTPIYEMPYAVTGILLEASHELDLIRWIFGDVHRVTESWVGNTRWEIPAEDTAHAVLHAHGLMIQLSLDMTRPKYQRRFSVKFDRGTVTVNLDRENVERTYRAEMEAFLKYVQTGERDYRTATLSDGIAALNLVHFIKASSR